MYFADKCHGFKALYVITDRVANRSVVKTTPGKINIWCILQEVFITVVDD